MTRSQLLTRLFDAASQTVCTVRVFDPTNPESLLTFRAWCESRGHEMIVDESDTYRLYRVSLMTGAHIAVGEVK